MFIDQYLVAAVLGIELLLFIWGPWRYDLVALGGLLFLAAVGIVPAASLFTGFSHPAVSTVIAVMLISATLQELGIVQRCVQWIERVGQNFTLQLIALCLPTMFLSSFMNNVGALAVFLPLTLEIARKSGTSPSLYLMPLAFSSLLGGMSTMIGTPPNIIIASARTLTGKESFSMFDFTPVGLTIAVVGVAWIILIGWRALPQRQKPQEFFDVKKYLTEVRIGGNSQLVEKTLEELETLSERQIQVISLKRDGAWRKMPSIYEKLQHDDLLLIEVDSNWLERWVQLGLVEIAGDFDFKSRDLKGEELELSEVVVMPGSQMIGRLAHQLRLRYRFGINLLAIGRREQLYRGNFRSLRFCIGDVLLLRAPSSLFQEAAHLLGCMPLASSEWRLKQSAQLAPALAAFIAAVIMIASGLFPSHLALSLCAFIYLVSGWLPLKKLYEVVPWPVVTLLAAMIPLGEALETTGGAQQLATLAISWAKNFPPVILLTCALGCTMILSDMINNAAAAIIVAPIAINIAASLGVDADPFLMCVALGASCSFLTPIGHQCNTLVMGPGGYRFQDYWRLGLPIDLLILIIAPSLILYHWPLQPLGA